MIASTRSLNRTRGSSSFQERQRASTSMVRELARSQQKCLLPPQQHIAAPLQFNSIGRDSHVVQVVETKQTDVYTTIQATEKASRPRVVILGSGWASMSFIKALPSNISEMYDIILVSPRNYFLYTPLLPAVATGTMEERSIVEAVRMLMIGKGEYYEAVCKEVNYKEKSLVCCFPADAGFADACFKVSYDVLIIGVGSVNNTFGIQGVEQYANYFKSIEDANRLRNRVNECFERAALPATTEEERKKLLSFVVVGGGPTGVEVAAEMHDMIVEDFVKIYPKLVPEVEIRVVDLMDHVLSTYDRAISNYTADQFKRAGIRLVLNSRVSSVSDGVLSIVNKAGETQDVKFGACVWATGIAMNPLLRSIQTQIPEQNHFRSVLTDDYMRVRGVDDGSIFAFGDSSTVYQPKAMDYVEDLFDQADTNKDSVLTLEEIRNVLVKASANFPHLSEHARFLDSRSGSLPRRFGSVVQNTLIGNGGSSPLAELDGNTKVTKEQFKEVLKKIDSGLRALPATAQVAKQQGEFLADVFVRNKITGRMDNVVAFGGSEIRKEERPFEYSHKGSAAYVGGDNAVFDVPRVGPLTGLFAGIVWKGFETYSQISFRNKVLVATDWVRTKLFGRDVSRV